ncbi:MAG: hypothetical protein QM784_26015 [Polyangiaceae bacterium]
MSVVSCAEPAQLGGLGVFNPHGLAYRVSVQNRYRPTTKASEGVAKPNAEAGRVPGAPEPSRKE